MKIKAKDLNKLNILTEKAKAIFFIYEVEHIQKRYQFKDIYEDIDQLEINVKTSFIGKIVNTILFPLWILQEGIPEAIHDLKNNWNMNRVEQSWSLNKGTEKYNRLLNFIEQQKK